MEYKQANTIKQMNENLNRLIEILNHRVTKLEISTKWIKWILTYISLILTGVFVSSIGGVL